MVNLDLAAPGRILSNPNRFSFLFAGLEAQPHPVTKIVQYGDPAKKTGIQATYLQAAGRQSCRYVVTHC